MQQSTKIIEYLYEVEGAIVIGGDFNLEIDTESLLTFEKNGYQNLIKEYNIPTTRNRLVWEKYPENRQYFSDYVFVTEDVKVVDFSVEEVEISDHLPMVLTMEG